MVLPMPPGPTIVTRRWRDSRETSVATASSRPIIRVTANGRLCDRRRRDGRRRRGQRRLLGADRRDEIVAPSGNGDDVAMAALAVAEGAAQGADLNLQVRFFDKGCGQARAISSSLPTTSPARSTRAARMSKARLPSRTGLSPSSSSRCAERSRNGPNEIARPSMELPVGFISFYRISLDGATAGRPPRSRLRPRAGAPSITAMGSPSPRCRRSPGSISVEVATRAIPIGESGARRISARAIADFCPQ